jgi:hypothetical protein
MHTIRLISGGIIGVMLLVFLKAPDRDAILAGRPSDLNDLMIAVLIYTFPLALGCCLMVFVWHRLREANVNVPPPVWLAGAGMILFLSGLISIELGLGRPPVMTAFRFDNYYSIASAAFGAYLSAYGWPLLICGVTAGVWLGFEIESHL